MELTFNSNILIILHRDCGPRLADRRARMYTNRYKPMTVGELVFETLSTGVITEDEVTWLTDHLQTFSRPEEAAAIRLGRLMDDGQVNLGCRVSKRWLHHREVLVDWIEPLGRHS